MKPEAFCPLLLESTLDESSLSRGTGFDLNLSYDTRYRLRFIHLLPFPSDEISLKRRAPTSPLEPA